MMIQVNLAIPVINCLLQPMLLLILIGNSGKKHVRTSSGQSVSDTVSQSTVDQSPSDTVSQLTVDQLRLDSNYVTDSVSQDSNDQDSNHGNIKENESEEDCMEICNLEASGSENQQFKGQF